MRILGWVGLVGGIGLTIAFFVLLALGQFNHWQGIARAAIIIPVIIIWSIRLITKHKPPEELETLEK